MVIRLRPRFWFSIGTTLPGRFSFSCGRNAWGDIVVWFGMRDFTLYENPAWKSSDEGAA